MPTDTQLNKLWELYSGYMGQMPINVRNQLSGMPSSEVENTLSNTRSQISSDAVSKAQQNIALLSSGMPEGGTKNYLQQIGQGWDVLSQMTGLKGVEEDASKSADFLASVAQRGPMFEQTMQGGLQGVSPTWLGATPDVVDKAFSFIPNVRLRQQMVQNYLGAAKTSMTNTLKALGGLYQTALVAAQTAAEQDQDRYNKILDYTKSLWTEVAWVNREQYEQTTPQALANLALTKAQTWKTLHPTLTSTELASQRVESLSQFLESRKGADGFISAKDYQEALNKWTAQKGTRGDFFANFPAETYMGKWEVAKLPEALRPTTIDIGASTEIKGTLQGAVNAANMGDLSQYNALPQQLKGFVAMKPMNVFGQPIIGGDGKPIIEYSYNEPTATDLNSLSASLNQQPQEAQPVSPTDYIKDENQVRQELTQMQQMGISKEQAKQAIDQAQFISFALKNRAYQILEEIY